MEWNHSNTVALAKQGCTLCFGLSLLRTRGKDDPCRCVLRAIFRICHRRFRKCATAEPQVKRQSWNPQRLSRRGHHSTGELSTAVRGRPERSRYGFPNEEYVTDFLNVAKRVLGIDTPLHQIFKWHFVHGADFRLVNRKLGRPIDDRNMFHDFYKVEEKLGRVFAELEPYGLYPLDEYFGSAVRGRRAASHELSAAS